MNIGKKLLNRILILILLITCFLLYIPNYINFFNKIDKYNIHNSSATYYKGSLNKGVILVEGFGSDQTSLTILRDKLLSNGYNVYTFDFSGHGKGQSGLTFDNAKTKKLALELKKNYINFKKISKLDDSNISLIGHSMGARIILQTSIRMIKPANIILLGTQINLSQNKQSEFFTGIQDSELEWINQLNKISATTLLISGEWDDILTPKNAKLLHNRLSPKTSKLKIFPVLTHNYEIFATRSTNYAIKFLNQQNKIITKKQFIDYSFIKYILWIISTILIIFILKNFQNKEKCLINYNKLIIPKYISIRILLWIPSLIIFALLLGSFYLIPLPFPAFNAYYFGFITANAIVLTIYLILKKQFKLLINYFFSGNFHITSFLIVFIIIISLIIIARSGLFYIYPLNDRLFWLIIFGGLTAFGFLINQVESDLIKINHPRRFIIIQYLPFILLIFLYLIIGSWSGLNLLFHGILILYIIILIGKLLSSYKNPPWLIALIQGYLLQLLILPQGVLFIK